MSTTSPNQSEELRTSQQQVSPNSSDSSNIEKNSEIYPQMGGFFERFVAFLIDGIILGVVKGIAGLSLSLGTATMGFSSSAVNFGTYPSKLLSILIAIAYFGYFYTKDGQSPGKKIMNLKVVKVGDYRYLNWKEVILREIIGKFLSSVVFFLGYLWYFMDEKRQTWHDMIAGSLVVRSDQRGEILMNGPAKYKKEPVKAFLPLGCFIIFSVSIIILMFFLFSSLLSMTSKKGAFESLDRNHLPTLEDLEGID